MCEVVSTKTIVFQHVHFLSHCFETKNYHCTCMSYSKQFNVTLDVKQWKALSPLLFIHFINDVNDLRLLCHNINVCWYASWVYELLNVIQINFETLKLYYLLNVLHNYIVYTISLIVTIGFIADLSINFWNFEY